MKVSPLGITDFHVEAESLSCNRPGCDYQHKATLQQVGDECPRCLRTSQSGRLERRVYQVDLLHCFPVGGCGCQHYTMTLAKKLREVPPPQRRLTPNEWRCKHITAARNFLKEDRNLDVLLDAITKQENQT